MQARLLRLGCKCQRPPSGLVARASRQLCSFAVALLALGVKGRRWVLWRAQAWSHLVHPCSSSPRADCPLQVLEAAVGFGGKRKPASLEYSLAGCKYQRPPSGLVASASRLPSVESCWL